MVTKNKSIKSLCSWIIAIALLVITVTSAAAVTDINITGISNYWRHLDEDLVVTSNTGDDLLMYYDRDGFIKDINTSPYSALNILKLGGQDYTENGDLYQVCDKNNKIICLADYSGGTLSTDDVSAVWGGATGELGMEFVARLPDYYVFSVITGGFTNFLRFTDSAFTINKTISGTTQGCVRSNNVGGFPHYNRCVSIFYDDAGGGDYYLILVSRTQNTFFTGSSIRFTKYYSNATHFSVVNSTAVGAGTDWTYQGQPSKPNYCWQDDDSNAIYCTKGGSGQVLWMYDIYGYGINVPYNFFIYGGYSFTSTYNYLNNWCSPTCVTYDLYVDASDEKILFYEDYVLENPNSTVTLSSNLLPYATLVVGDAIIYTNGAGSSRLVTGSLLAGEVSVPLINATNETAINITEIGDYTATEYNALFVVDEDNALVAGTIEGDDRLVKLDISDPTNIVALANITLSDTPYKISMSGNRVFVATDNEVHVIDGYATNNFSLVSTDGWGRIFYTDKTYSVSAVNTTNTFLCDRHEEPDYHTVGEAPEGNVGGGCFDLSYNDSGYLLVDRDDDGVALYNVTNPPTFILLDTDDQRTSSHGRDYGDLLYFDGRSLVAIENLYSLSYYVTTNQTLTHLTTCNNGGAGQSISSEFIEPYAFGGLINGRIMVCDVTNTDETTNTVWETIVGADDEPIIAIEKGFDGTIHMISTTHYIITNFSLYNITSNTPPTIDNYSVSSVTLSIDEPTDITIFAGNVEPEDVIYYGIKCEGTETTYTFNTNGLHSCTYNSSGVYDMLIAITDNYHYPTWYDETSIEITVSEDIFVGGVLRIQVLDETHTNPIIGATVNANNETKYTNTEGLATFTTPTTGLYEVVTTKTGYYTDVSNYYSDSTTHIVSLIILGTGTETILEVTVIDAVGNYVESVLVSYTNTISYEYDYTFTNGLGFALFRGLDSGTVIVQASKEDFEAESEAVAIGANQTTSVTLTLEKELAGATKTHLDRNCRDDGIWLCGDVATVCINDSDCLSDSCTVGFCSRFNYTVCDENNYPRSQSCIFHFTTQSWLGSLADWLLSNLLYVVILLIVTVGIGFVAVSWRRN